MSHRVRIEPSGHEFSVDGDSTFLEAALRSGLSMQYGCSNGTCGECRARVRSGDVSKVRQHDFPLGHSEVLAGAILLCSCAPASDVVIEAAEADGIKEIPQQTVRTRAVRIQRRDQGMVVTGLKVSRAGVFRFFAGQQARIVLPTGLATTTWVASCPCDGRELEFHFDPAEDGAICEWFTNTARRTDPVWIEGPVGSFTLDRSSERPLIMVAMDAAFAPIYSLIGHVINLELETEVRLYLYTSRGSRHYADNYARAWADALDDFQYTGVTGSGDVATDAHRLAGRISGDCAELPGWDAYITGPTESVGVLRSGLLKAGLPESRCFTDSRHTG